MESNIKNFTLVGIIEDNLGLQIFSYQKILIYLICIELALLIKSLFKIKENSIRKL